MNLQSGPRSNARFDGRHTRDRWACCAGGQRFRRGVRGGGSAYRGGCELCSAASPPARASLDDIVCGAGRKRRACPLRCHASTPGPGHVRLHSFGSRTRDVEGRGDLRTRASHRLVDRCPSVSVSARARDACGGTGRRDAAGDVVCWLQLRHRDRHHGHAGGRARAQGPCITRNDLRVEPPRQCAATQHHRGRVPRISHGARVWG
jgi:hypothetical protein